MRHFITMVTVCMNLGRPTVRIIEYNIVKLTDGTTQMESYRANYSSCVLIIWYMMHAVVLVAVLEMCVNISPLLSGSKM